MKSIFLLVTTAALGLTLIASAGVQTVQAGGPQLEVGGPAKLDAKGNTEVVGKGFEPGVEVTLLLTTADGVESDIGYALKPAPKAGVDGTWTTIWSYGRFVKKKLVKEGSYTITAVDQDFGPLATTVVEFVK